MAPKTPAPATPVPGSGGDRVGPGLLWWLVVLVLLVVAVYQPTWQAGFVWDDDAHRIRPGLQSLAGLGRIWADLDATQQYYPLTYSVFWIQQRLWGADPLGYHLVNVLLHAVNAWLVLVLLRRLRVPGAALAALVFALHPVMVESVAWITELKNTLSGLFYLAAALVYLRFDATRQGRWYGLALGLFVLGLLSKTIVATLPAALLVVFWWQRGRLDWRRDARPLLPLFVLGIGAGVFTALVERHLVGAQGAEFAFSPLERCLVAGRVPWFYLGKLVWPVNLSFIYPRWAVNPASAGQYVYPLATVATLGLAWHYRARARGPLAAVLFFGGTLVPVLGFVNVYPFIFSFVADHFQYLASLGPITLAAATVTVHARRRARPRTAIALATVILALLATLSWRQARLYHDRETLWRDTLAKNPACWLAHNNLGKLLLEGGQVEPAQWHFRQAIGVRPHHIEALVNLGVAQAQAGQLAAALGQFEQALRFKPDYALAHNNLGLALTRAGRLPEAIGHLRRALEIDPGYPEAHYNLGLALLQAERPAGAVAVLEQAGRLRPGHAGTWHALGQARTRQGQTAAAAAAYATAVRLAPTDAGVLNDLAWLRATAAEPHLRDGPAAVRLAEQAAEQSGRQQAGILDTLAAAYAEAGRFADAVRTADEAIARARAADQPELAAEFAAHRERFRRGQPWRETAGGRRQAEDYRLKTTD